MEIEMYIQPARAGPTRRGDIGIDPYDQLYQYHFMQPATPLHPLPLPILAPPASLYLRQIRRGCPARPSHPSAIAFLKSEPWIQ